MKFSKKKVLVVSLIVCLVAILSFGSLAWFNDSASVTNTFKVATSTDPEDPLFDVTVYECKVDENGKKIDGQWVYDFNGNPAGNTYDRIVPGQSYDKYATVTNLGMYDEYVRVCVTFDKGATWLDICNKYGIEPRSIYQVTSDWAYTTEIKPTAENGNKLTYVYYLKRVLEYKNKTANKTDFARVFEEVTIPKQFTQQDMKYLDGVFNLTVTADAIQAEALPIDVVVNDYNGAQEAFVDGVNWAPMTAYEYKN